MNHLELLSNYVVLAYDKSGIKDAVYQLGGGYV